MNNEELDGVKFSEFPSQTPGNSDEVVGLHSGDNARFSIANIIATIRQGLASIFVPQSRTVNSKSLSSDITLTMDDISNGTTYAKTTAEQVAQIGTNKADIDTIEGKIPSAASTTNQLADKAFVTDSITQGTAIFRGSFATKAALLAVAWQTTNPDAPYFVSNNDYAVVLDDETQNDECWRYIYVTGTGWTQQYKINESPMTQAQLDALNSGATAAIISSVADKLDKTGDGKDVTATFTAASTRVNISTGEKLSVLFGKISKWFTDLGTAAFRAATGSITSGSSDLVESGAVYTGLAGKQNTITANGILKGDGAGGVSAATPGSDYQAPLTAGTDYATPAQLADKANQSQLAYVETGTTATKTGGYTAGEYICWQGTLYTANTNIAYGTTLSAATNGNLTECVGGGLNEVLFVDIPYNSFEWFTGLPAFRALYTIPTGYYIAAINVFFTNGSAIAGPRYSNGYIYIIGLNGRGQAIDSTYEFVCTVMLRRT